VDVISPLQLVRAQPKKAKPTCRSSSFRRGRVVVVMADARSAFGADHLAGWAGAAVAVVTAGGRRKRRCGRQLTCWRPRHPSGLAVLVGQTRRRDGGIAGSTAKSTVQDDRRRGSRRERGGLCAETPTHIHSQILDADRWDPATHDEESGVAHLERDAVYTSGMLRSLSKSESVVTVRGARAGLHPDVDASPRLSARPQHVHDVTVLAGAHHRQRSLHVGPARSVRSVRCWSSWRCCGS
jgi:hypothetical protein